MKRNTLCFVPILILVLVACNFINAGNTPVPTSTPTITPTATLIAIPGDLGFGDITGKVTDAVTGLPIPNATVTCEHFSYTSKESDRCNRSTTTDENGVFLFDKVFFHDTDTIMLTGEAAGYQKVEMKQAFFTWNEWKVDFSLKHLP